ncbi:MAG: hypothetical protein AAF289_06330 [Cyanobacteria bacterium P01_A01_bin.135]
MSYPYFSVETVDGCRLGRLSVPYTQIADWLNFLSAPHYDAEIISAQQDQRGVDLYFDASDGVYLYLETALNQALGGASLRGPVLERAC